MEQVELSFVVPAYNEESFIEDMLGALDAVIADKNLPYEIVVVDDGSRDGTLAKARRYAGKNGHARVVSYSKNVGKGCAVKTGFTKANGSIVVFADEGIAGHALPYILQRGRDDRPPRREIPEDV